MSWKSSKRWIFRDIRSADLVWIVIAAMLAIDGHIWWVMLVVFFGSGLVAILSEISG